MIHFAALYFRKQEGKKKKKTHQILFTKSSREEKKKAYITKQMKFYLFINMNNIISNSIDI